MTVQAKTVEETFGAVTPPTPISNIGFGAAGISNFLTTMIDLIFVVGGILFLFMFLFGAIQYILSGGDKEAVKNAQRRITFAIIGIALLALSFFLLRIIGQILQFSFTK